MDEKELRKQLEKKEGPVNDAFWGELKKEVLGEYDCNCYGDSDELVESLVKLTKLSKRYNPSSGGSNAKKKYGGRVGTGWKYQKLMHKQRRLKSDIELIRFLNNTKDWSTIAKTYNNTHGTSKRDDTLRREYYRANRSLKGYDEDAELDKSFGELLNNQQTRFEKQYKHPAARVFEISCIISNLEQKEPTGIRNAFLNYYRLLYSKYKQELVALEAQRCANMDSAMDTENTQ
ncbi:MAG: hypothetical protein ABFD64_07055 [Armatimonadota bacterium]